MRNSIKTILITSSLIGGAWANENNLSSVNNLVGEQLASAVVKTQEAPTNFMVSAVSMKQALGVLANGAEGTTKDQLSSFFKSSLKDVNSSSKQLITELNFTQEQKDEMTQNNRYLTPAVISSQNSIWNTNGATDGARFQFAEDFKSQVKEFYNVDAYEFDFKEKSTTLKINQWGEDRTNGLIKNILNYDEVKDLLWIIMNATYLEANWSKGFHTLKENSPSFALLDGTKADAEMMRSTQYVNRMKLTDGAEMVAIQLSSDQPGTDLAFVAYLPQESANFKEAQLNFFQTELKKIVLPQLVSRVPVENTVVTMPKFSFATSTTLKVNAEITKEMGLNFLFQDGVNFGKMEKEGSDQSKVGFIKQDSKIELDEKGIKAAAITVIGAVRATSILPRPTREFTLDRAFSFAIVDRNTQAVLFSGSVVNPTK